MAAFGLAGLTFVGCSQAPADTVTPVATTTQAAYVLDINSDLDSQNWEPMLSVVMTIVHTSSSSGGSLA